MSGKWAHEIVRIIWRNLSEGRPVLLSSGYMETSRLRRIGLLNGEMAERKIRTLWNWKTGYRADVVAIDPMVREAIPAFPCASS